MKQVLFVGAGHRFPEGTFRFLYQMQLQEHVHARGLFFKPIDYAAIAAIAAPAGVSAVMEMDTREQEIVAEQKSLFAHHCAQHYIQHVVAEYEDHWDLDHFAEETRFADLVLISEELFCAENDPHQPNSLLRQALRTAECPVVIVPETFEKIDHLFMAYDGKAESMHAIRQFSYLFPQLLTTPTEIIFSKEEEEDILPEMDNLKRYAKTKFDNLSYTKLHFDPAHYFSTWISEKRNVMLICGSFGRSSLSYMGRHSFVEQVIHEHKVPLFIAHR